MYRLLVSLSLSLLFLSADEVSSCADSEGLKTKLPWSESASELYRPSEEGATWSA
jgi:hypothetical protein